MPGKQHSVELQKDSMKATPNRTGHEITALHGLILSQRSTALMANLETKPGATVKPLFPPRASRPNVLIYKVMEKMFAIMSIRGKEGVILKCDPELVPFLREKYEGVGHRSHLDPRHWISVRLDADVPDDEVERLVIHSYELVCSKLTRRQKAALAALSTS